MFFSTNCPKIGIFSRNMSHPNRPCLNFRTSLTNNHRPIGTPGIRNHHFTMKSEVVMSICVMSGSSVPKSAKIFWKAGTIFNMMNTRMPVAKITMAIG